MADAIVDYEDSSGNVFADLGLPDADDLAYKAGLTGSIMRYGETPARCLGKVAQKIWQIPLFFSSMMPGNWGNWSGYPLIHFRAPARLPSVRLQRVVP